MSAQTPTRRRLGDILVERKLVTQAQLDQALRVQVQEQHTAREAVRNGTKTADLQRPRRVGDILVERQAISQSALDLVIDEIVQQAKLPALPASTANAAVLVGHTLYVLSGRLSTVAIQSWLSDANRMAAGVIDVLECSVQEFSNAKGRSSGSSDVAQLSAVKQVRQLIADAVGKKASDLHMTLTEDANSGGLAVQLRVNGDLVPHREFTQEEGSQMIRAMFQGMAAVTDATVREGEDQHAVITDEAFLRSPSGSMLPLSGIRLARAPLVAGMNLAARLLYSRKETDTSEARLARLGYSPRQLGNLAVLARTTEGVNAITGPTGSGKSTTLVQQIYAVLDARDGVRVITIEDPVEYEFRHPRVWQYRIANANTDEEKSAAFAGKLKTALRQDPDIIMVGEIRGLETAKEAINASLTGHQVWTTLHVNDPFMVVQRLAGMGVDKFFLTDPKMVSSLIAQRLVKTLCPHCSIPAGTQAPPEGMAQSDWKHLMDWAELTPFRGIDQVRLRGPQTKLTCPHCAGSGFIGRTVVSQVILTDERLLLDMVNRGPADARRNYMGRADAEIDMRMHGLLKVLAGQVDPRSMISVLGPIEAVYPEVRNMEDSDL